MTYRLATVVALRPPSVFARFAGDRRGVSAVEFALLLPVMIPLYLGTVEFSQGFDMSRKVTLIAGTVANVTAQNTTLTTAAVANILNASTAIISPYSASGLTATVSCISINAKGQATVAWSATLNGTALSAGSTVTVPSGLAVPSSQLIFSQVSYPYTPNLGYVITGTLNLAAQNYIMPRITAPSYNGTVCS
jgi:Flp pilus assembly protein TadG